VQECGAGLVRLQVESGEGGAPWIAFELPQPQVTPLDEASVAELEALLGQPLRRGEAAPRLIDVGARWVVAQLADARAVLACNPDFARMKRQSLLDHATGVTLFGEHEAGAPARIEVRSFAPACGVDEDPVCGSGNGCVAVFIRDSGQMERIGRRYVAAQGARLGRDGRVRVDVEAQRIRVAGQAVSCIDGRLAL
jgi:PhzF family phenazine biosynthesis protein